ncbi:MAG: FAD-dependent oxidoreductase [Bacillota bacterium]
MQSGASNLTGAVLILGSGIGGMQAALDLAEGGFKVYLVEKSPAIGGTMPMLDKTFPTNDCSMCILSPKLVECGRHRNIAVLTQAEVIDFRGEPGNFTVTVKKHPRYVDAAKCLSCGSCAEECPVEVPDGFNQQLGVRKAIYKPYPQAFPNAYVVDKENCLECMACVDACPVGAIDHEMAEEIVAITVGAVIVSPGFDLFNPRLRGEFGFGEYTNVLTSLQFERMLSASGPFGGHLKRPSDGVAPKKIAFLQCVGSRDAARGQGYCSAVCCMHAAKEAIVAKEHEPGLDAAIFYMDVRSSGKDFEKYYLRAKDEYNVRYVRCLVSSVKELQKTKNLRLRYRGESGRVQEEDFDLVVLSAGLKPSPEAVETAKRLGLELNPYSFCRVAPFSGVASSRPGVFVAGAFAEPKDIPETVMQASAAAGEAAAFLAAAKNTLVTEKQFPPERDVRAEEPRIGVFVCHCGINIGSVVDVPAVAAAASKLPGVVHAQENLYACSQDSQAALKDLIREKGLNRVVIASCSVRTHKPLFQETIREAGLNRHLVEMANIRDQCSWVHRDEPARATAKAFDLVRAAVAKAARLYPIREITVGVTPAALVVGGGLSGLTAALDLARQGYRVELVEKSDALGGAARRLRWGFFGEDVREHLQQLIAQATSHPLIKVHTGCEVVEVRGYPGNFTSRLSTGEEIRYGTAVLAIGGEESKPEEYRYGEDDRVVTQMELEEALAAGDPRAQAAQNFVFIQCVGSREGNRQYCVRVCCAKAVKLALRIKQRNPAANVFVLYREMRTYGFLEDLYREARAQGVVFVRYEVEHKPLVESPDGRNGKLRVTVREPVLGEDLQIPADLVALAPAILPPAGNRKVAQLFKVPLNADGFFLEAHMKLRPVDFPAEGIYLCGLCHSPKNMLESIIQAKAAAARAAVILSRDRLEVKGVTARVDISKCQACLTCVRLCPFNAPRIDPETNVAQIEAVLCQGCGTCAGECPNKAITLQGYTDEQQMSAVRGLFGEG